MAKLLAAFIALFLLVDSAAAAYKLEPLTNDQRAEMRARAERLKDERYAQESHHEGIHRRATHHPMRHHHNHHNQHHHKATTNS